MLARLGTAALIVLSISVQASADAPTRNRSIAACTSFDQADKDDDTVQFTIRNSCTIPLDCEISWKVVCAPDSKKRRVTHARTQKLALTNDTSQSAEASATVCGDASWVIEDVQWSCAPNKD